MSAKVKVLIVGTTNADSQTDAGEEITRSTITLIREGDLKIIVDPGVLESQQVLIDALAEEGLTPDDINIVCITHSHIDHYRNIGMFQNAKTLEYYGLWSGESVEAWPEHFSPNIRILKTPGHSSTGITVFVTTDDGVVAICGDIFWKENYPENPEEDLYASDPTALAKSRRIVLDIADWIIPGHADIYEVKKTVLQNLKKGFLNKKQKAVPKYCRHCNRPFVGQGEICLCRPWLCYRCCLCGIDCDTCSCSHKRSH